MLRGTMAGSRPLGIHMTDLLFDGWDLSWTTGQTTSPNDLPP